MRSSGLGQGQWGTWFCSRSRSGQRARRRRRLVKMTTLASILITLAVALLRAVLQQRQAANDAHEVGRLGAIVQNLEAQNAALKFKADALRNPAAASQLRVLDPGGAIELQDPD